MRETAYATRGQLAIEDRALALLERPELERTRAVATMLFDSVFAWEERDQRALIDSMIDQYVFHHAFRAANWDPNFPEAARFMVRDAHADWIGQSPNRLAVARLNPDGGPKAEDDMARHAAKIALEGVYYAYYCMQSGKGKAPNTVRPPMSSAAFGGVPTQWGTKGFIALADDEALITRSNGAGAGFRNLTLTDAFHISIEYWQRTSSLNVLQLAADDDGDFTCVVSRHDPGVHNWLDTGGVPRMNFGQRWQAFGLGAARGDPWMMTELVKLDDLERRLPSGVRRIDAAGRSAQIAIRREGFATRFTEAPAT